MDPRASASSCQPSGRLNVKVQPHVPASVDNFPLQTKVNQLPFVSSLAHAASSSEQLPTHWRRDRQLATQELTALPYHPTIVSIRPQQARGGLIETTARRRSAPLRM